MSSAQPPRDSARFSESGSPVSGAELPLKAADTTCERPWPLHVLAQKMKDYIDRMSPVWIEGQLVEVRTRGKWRQTFMTLRDVDVDASLSMVCDAKTLAGLPESSRDGARVVARCKAEYWTSRGSLMMRALELQPVGEGVLLAQIEQLKQKLAAEGLFAPERKRALPFLPRVIGLVCGRNSAAEKDVVVTATTRWPGVRFEIREVAVQGDLAVKQVPKAVAELDALPEVDVIVVARGGGSLEDLLPFSTEELVRAVAGCRTPTVSAIGHEVDNPVLDFVADVRAYTPTDAGRRVVPEVAGERAALEQARDRMRRQVVHLVSSERQKLADVASRPCLADPGERIVGERQNVELTLGRLRSAVGRGLDRDRLAVATLAAKVQALSPHSTLARGYAVVEGAGGVVSSADGMSVGDHVRVRVCDGYFDADVTSATTVDKDASS